MDEGYKEILMHSVNYDTIGIVRNTFSEYELIQDESYFDYDLLKAALNRKDPEIVNFLLKLRCRVRNPNKINSEETPLHLAVRSNDSKIVLNILERGASIYDKNTKGETPIQAGFRKGLYNVVNVILNFYVPINFIKKSLHPMDADDVRHFHIACILNNLNVVKQYLKLGFSVNSPLSLNSPEFTGLNPMHYAIKRGNSELLELLLKNGGDLTVKDTNGQTPLHIMYYSDLCGSPALKKVFIYGNDTKFINSVDSNGVSIFHMCCTLNYPDLIETFIGKGADANSAVSFDCSRYPGYTPLHFAAKYNCTEVAEVLLKNGADCNKADRNGTTALHVAFYQAVDLRDSIIDMLISGIPRKIDYSDDKGLSHFHVVCTRGDAGRVSDFLESGVSVDSRVVAGLYSGYTALHFAVLCNQKDVVQALLERNAKINIKTSQFKLSPLHIACKFYVKYHAMEIRYNYNPAYADWTSHCKTALDIVKILLRHRADVDSQDYLGKTPLLQTCPTGKVFFRNCNFSDTFLKGFLATQRKIFEILLSNNANINACTNNGESILHAITKSDFLNDSCEDLVEFLICEGADLNAADAAGFTPLHLAVHRVNAGLVNLFLKYNSNVNAKTKCGATPLEIAIDNVDQRPSKRAKRIFRTLLENGADGDLINKNGQTLLQDAVRNRQTFVAKELLRNEANVNKIDSKCRTIGFILSAWYKYIDDYELLYKPGYSEIVETIFVHNQKLMALGYGVDEEIQQFCIKLLHRFERAVAMFYDWPRSGSPIDFIGLERIYHDCVKELERMKLVKINDCTSLYDVLLLRDVKTLTVVTHGAFEEVIQDHSSFPLYSYELERKFKKVLRRNAEMELGRKSSL